MTRNYTIQPLKVTPWTFLGDFDEHEAKEADWPQELITACLREIQRRELAPNEERASKEVAT